MCGGCGWGRLVPSMCFAMSGCACERSSLRFLKLVADCIGMTA